MVAIFLPLSGLSQRIRFGSRHRPGSRELFGEFLGLEAADDRFPSALSTVSRLPNR
jgi:hypothetical protein